MTGRSRRNIVLSPDDLQLVERDGDIPGLGTVLDTEALTKALHANLPDAGVRTVEANYAHYKPHTSCLVAGRLVTADTELPFYAKAYGADGPVKLEKTRRLRDFPSPVGPGTLILDEARIGLYFFPVDHRLKGIRRLAYPDTKRSLLRGLLGKSHEFSDATLRHLRYKPERRFVACLEMPDGPRSLLKFFTPERYMAAKSAAQAICSQGLPVMERTAYFSDRHNVIGFEWFAGCLLSQTILSPDIPEQDKASAVEQTGAALAELHSCVANTLTRQRRADEICRLDAQAVTIRHLCPVLGDQAEQLCRKIVSSLENIAEETTLLHGDFYDKQVLFTDDNPVILDLDEARLGHPAIDLGLFLAHLERHRLNHRLSSHEAGVLEDALVRGYQLVRPAPAQAAIRLYTAIGLLHLAAEPFRYRDSNWREKIRSQLSHVDAILERNSALRPLRRAIV
jgi:aminoglycoside phosphotransferase (APT) family kinase protein